MSTENEINLLSIADGEDKSLAFKNRLRKNYRHLRKWAKRTLTDCFRIYDKEIHNYPFAIDYYAGRFCVHYFARKAESEEIPQKAIDEVNETLQSIFGVSLDAIFWRTRIKRKQYQQYEKIGASKDFFTVHEYGVKFKVNLLDYLDTGLFLDHRETRQLVSNVSKDKRLLNLFAYTCSFSVHAACKGAVFTKSVDMSNTYTDWGKENFIINGLTSQTNKIVREDCLKFLDDEIYAGVKYDLIVIDPPTISRSKKMTQMFDIQRDYLMLITKALKLLHEKGTIFFSTNSRGFSFEKNVQLPFTVEDISYKTLPQDFHNKKIHKCWKIFGQG